MIDPMIERVRFTVAVQHPALAIQNLLEAGYRIVVVPRRASAYCPLDGRLRWRRVFSFLTCASTVGLALGLRRLSWTPKGLYRYLMTHGGEELRYEKGAKGTE